jgi:hypothetical protein
MKEQSSIQFWVKKFLEKVKTGFRYSSLEKLTKVNPHPPEEILKTSNILQHVKRMSTVIKLRTAMYLDASRIVALLKDLKKEFCDLPLASAGIVVLTAISTNIVIVIFTDKTISLFGWLIRGLLLLAALAGLFYRRGWSNVKDSSILLKK